MRRTRPLVTVLLLGLATSGLVATGTSATVADPAFSVSGTAPRAAAHPPLVQGLVVDQLGHFVDDVDVRAIRSNGDPAASALTYASDRADGPQHGYFYLEVGAKGTYTLRLKKAGYVTTAVEEVEITRLRQRLALGEITMTKVMGSKTTASLAHSRIAPDEKGRVTVTVTGRGTNRPAGAVEVRDGRKVVGTGRLRPAARGRLAVTLKRLDAGRHDLKTYFLGSKTLRASSSRAVTLTVRKPRRHHRAATDAR